MANHKNEMPRSNCYERLSLARDVGLTDPGKLAFLTGYRPSTVAVGLRVLKQFGGDARLAARARCEASMKCRSEARSAKDGDL